MLGLVALGLIPVSCVPDAYPDPCGFCEGACEAGACEVTTLSALDSDVLAFDVGPRFLHLCVRTAGGSYLLLDVPKGGGKAAKRATLSCEALRYSDERGYFYVTTNDGLMRGPDEGGPLAPLGADPPLATLDARGTSVAYVKAEGADVFVAPAEGGAERQLNPITGAHVGLVRLSANGRYAYVEPETEAVWGGTLDDIAPPTLLYNGQRELVDEPAPVAIVFAGEELYAAHRGALMRLDAGEAQPPETIREELDLDVELDADEFALVFAERARGEVRLLDLMLGLEYRVGGGLSEPHIALDGEHVFVTEAGGRVGRFLRPDTVR